MSTYKLSQFGFLLLCHTGKLEQVKQEIKSGRNINEPAGSLDYTGLHYAVTGFQPEVVQILVDNGANIFAQNECGNTPIFQCVIKLCYTETNEQEQLCKIIFEKLLLHELFRSVHKLDKFRQLQIPNKDGWLPLQRAALKSQSLYQELNEVAQSWLQFQNWLPINVGLRHRLQLHPKDVE